MAFGISLLQEDTIYKKTTTSAGEWVGGQYIQSTADSIDAMTAIVEPYQSGESTLILPTGVMSTDAKLIYSQELLTVASNLTGNITDGSIVYMDDPTTNTNTPAYVIMDKEEWSGNAGFTLMQAYNIYLAIRKENT